MFHNADETIYAFAVEGLTNTGLQVLSFDGIESIDAEYVFEITLVNKHIRYDITKLLSKPAYLSFAKENKGIHGIIHSVKRGPVGGHYAQYTVILAPRFTHLYKRINQRTFVGKTVPEIITMILNEYSLQQSDKNGFEFKFKDQQVYTPRDFCVQYDESDAHFIHRLCEEEGIAQHYEFSEDSHQLVFTDSQPFFPSVANTVRYASDTGMVADEPVFKKFDVNLASATTASCFRNYNFENMKIPEGSAKGILNEKANQAVEAELEYYDYPQYHTNQQQAQRYAEIQIERLRVDHIQAEACSDVPDLHAGYFVTVANYPVLDSLDAEQPWLIKQIKHQGRQPQVLEALGGEVSAIGLVPTQLNKYFRYPIAEELQFAFDSFSQGYRNCLVATPHMVVHRPKSLHLKPKVFGVQTAIVTGPKNEEIYCDDYGRVKVQFHWDREGSYDENSSHWIRVASNWAHNGYGSVVIPRIGMEVKVDFLEGDPDNPLITGAIHNGVNKVPYDLPANKTRTVFKTNSSKGGKGSNELRIEDKKDQEEIYIHAQKDMNTKVLNDMSTEVLHDKTVKVHNNLNTQVFNVMNTEVKVDQNTRILNNMNVEVLNTKSTQIRNNEIVEVTNNRMHHIVGDDNLFVNRERRVQSNLDFSVITDQTLHMRAAVNYLAMAGNEIHFQAGSKVVIDAGAEITLQAGGNFLKIDGSGISSSPAVHLGIGVPGVGTPAVPRPPISLMGVTPPNYYQSVAGNEFGQALPINSPKIVIPEPLLNEAEGMSDCMCPDSPLVGGPINPILGAKVLPVKVDFSQPAPTPFVFNRSYNSRDGRCSSLGQGWSITGENIGLEVYENSTIVIDAVGRRIHFSALQPGQGLYSASEQFWIRRGGTSDIVLAWDEMWYAVPEELRNDSAAYFLMKEGNVSVLKQVAGKWRLHQELYKNGHKTLYRWNEFGHLNAVQDSANAIYIFFYTQYTTAVEQDTGHRLHSVGLLKDVNKLADVPSQINSETLDITWLVYYSFNEEGDLEEVYNKDHEIVVSYDWQNHMMTKLSEPTGRTIHYKWDQYNPQGKVVEQAEEDGLIYYYTYHDDHTEVKDNLDRIEHYYFKGTGGLQRWTAYERADGSRIEYEYDRLGRLIATLDPLGRKKLNQLDSKGRLVGMTMPDGGQWTYKLDQKTGKPLEIIAPEGQFTQMMYDKQGNLISVTEPTGAVTKYQYDNPTLPNNPTQIIDAKDGVKKLEWSSVGQLVSYTDCSNNTLQKEYDGNGLLISEINAKGEKISYGYDNKSRLTQVKMADGSQIEYQYDILGRIIAVVDPKKQTTRIEYDRFSRVIKTTDPAGLEVKYDYDKANRIIQITNENGALATFEYDVLDRLIEEKNFDGTTKQYQYNAADEVISVTDSLGRKINYKYDPMGRITEHQLPATDVHGVLTEHFIWRKDGLLASAINLDVAVVYDYDRAGRLIRESQTHLDDNWYYQVDQTFDIMSNIEKISYNNAPALSWLRYGAGHLHGLIVDQVEMMFERDQLHREIKRNAIVAGSQNPVFETDTYYNSLGQISNSAVTVGTNQWQRHYQYNKLGQLEQIKDNLLPEIKYQYDNSGRLIGSEHGGQMFNYHFDAAGNRYIPKDKAQSLTTQPKKQVIDEDDELLEILNPELLVKKLHQHTIIKEKKKDKTINTPKVVWANNQIIEFNDSCYQYDQVGNLIQIKRIDGTRLDMKYDALNRLVKLTCNSARGNLQTAYTYDAFSRRTRKITDNGQQTNIVRYGWHGDKLCSESKNNKERTIVYHPSTFIPLLSIEHDEMEVPIEIRQCRRQFEEANLELPMDLVFKPENLRIAFYHTDHLGTPLIMTNTSGEELWSAEVDDWRAIKNVKGSIDQPIRFQGQLEDEESGLYYNRNRYYDPELGRYVTHDPIGFKGGLNTFNYPTDPVRLVDPMGLKPLSKDCCEKFKLLINHDETQSSAAGTTCSSKYNSLSFKDEILGLNCDFESIGGPIDIDWMLRSAGCVFGRVPGFSNATYFVGKGLWNMANGVSPTTNIMAEGHRNAPIAAYHWMQSGESLRTIFAPAIQDCATKFNVII